MSYQLIDHSPDLKKLKEEGYEIEIKNDYLFVHHVPYLNSNKEVKYGTLISPIQTQEGSTVRLNVVHWLYFKGDMPCYEDGTTIAAIFNAQAPQHLFDELYSDRLFSARPPTGYYDDYYQKVITYLSIICPPALKIDPSATAQTCRVLYTENEEEAIFHYSDTNTSRSNLSSISNKLKGQIIGIIGLGGTGSYILDFIAKTPVSKIHLFDKDIFSQHNAFRSPGAASLEQLSGNKKVNYYHEVYSKMHKKIITHDFDISEKTYSLLDEMSFVFISIDTSDGKKKLMEYLIQNEIPFVDVGMGVIKKNDFLLGSLRVTTGTSTKYDHLEKNISFSEIEENEYNSNIQVAELNALNAALAVIKWKKFSGFYYDGEKEHNSLFTISISQIVNDEN